MLRLRALVCAQVQSVGANSAPVVSREKVDKVLRLLFEETKIRNADLWFARSDAETSATQAFSLMVRTFLLRLLTPLAAPSAPGRCLVN